jgi:predicted DNA-binding transcriptional regulator AlpA
MTRLLRPAEVAEVLGVSERTLANWRCASAGPSYVKAGGRVGYRESAVEEYLAKHEVETERGIR